MRATGAVARHRRHVVDAGADALTCGNTMPIRATHPATGAPLLAWPVAGAGHVLEFTDSLNPPNWQPVTEPRGTAGPNLNVPDPTAGPRRFYRLRQP